jgi:hypothetical protein
MKSIKISQLRTAATTPFEERVCTVVCGILGRPFDLDLGILVHSIRGEGEPNLYWYEIHPEHSEAHPLEPDTTSEEGVKMFEALKPLFAEIGAPVADSAVGQEFFMGYNWLRVEGEKLVVTPQDEFVTT